MNSINVELSDATMALLRREAEEMGVTTEARATGLLTFTLISRDLEREAEDPAKGVA